MELQYIADITARSILGDHNIALETHEQIQTPNSLVFRLEYLIGNISKTVYVKIPIEGKNSRQTAKIIKRLKYEFQLAKLIESKFNSTEELEVVSPAGYIDEINGFVTWEVQGNELQDIINNKLRFHYGGAIPELERLAKLTGEWLYRFHSMEIVDNQFDLRKDILNYCGDRLDLLVNKKNSQVSTTLAKSIMHNIETWVNDALFKSDVKLVLCHNDFSPHNIIVTDKGVCVLDFSYSTPGLPAFDLACFWHKLEDLKWSILRGNKGMEAIQNQFLTAYGSNFDMSRPDIKLGLTRLTLSKMLTLLDSPVTLGYREFEKKRRYSRYLKLLKSGFETSATGVG